MACIGNHDFACECGTLRLASSPSESGRVLLCPQCARAYLAQHGSSAAPASIPWSELEREVETRLSDLYAFEWLRGNVPWDERRTLSEPAPRRFLVADRAGTALGFAFALIAILVACRAVFS